MTDKEYLNYLLENSQPNKKLSDEKIKMKRLEFRFKIEPYILLSILITFGFFVTIFGISGMVGLLLIEQTPSIAFLIVGIALLLLSYPIFLVDKNINTQNLILTLEKMKKNK
jgi:4-hydroxybenzoate polyprenyltransferase